MSQVAATETAQTAAMGAAAMASATLAASANGSGIKVGRCLRPCPRISSSGTPKRLLLSLPIDRTSWVLGLPATAR